MRCLFDFPFSLGIFFCLLRLEGGALTLLLDGYVAEIPPREFRKGSFSLFFYLHGKRGHLAKAQTGAGIRPGTVPRTRRLTYVSSNRENHQPKLNPLPKITPV